MVLLLNKTAPLVSQDDFLSSLNPYQRSQFTDLWSRLLQLLSHITVCTDSECRFYATPEFTSVCRAALIRLFFPTLLAIRARTPNSIALQTWTKFAGAFGVTEESLLEEWKRDMQCCNPSYPKRWESGGKSTQRCSRCKDINYCGLNSQRRLGSLLYKRRVSDDRGPTVTGGATSPNVKLFDAFGLSLNFLS
jgi:hypothetical protein